jgi:hypothetical protein
MLRPCRFTEPLWARCTIAKEGTRMNTDLNFQAGIYLRWLYWLTQLQDISITIFDRKLPHAVFKIFNY